MNRVESFQSEAQEVLCQAEPNTVKLKQLLDTAIALDVDLPEIPKLKQELHQCRWLEKVEETLQDTRQVSLDILRALLDEAAMLSRKQGTCSNNEQRENFVVSSGIANSSIFFIRGI